MSGLIESNHIEMSLQEWMDKYKPIPVPSHIKDYSVGVIDETSYGIETFGDNAEYVMQVLKEKPDCVWTYHDNGEFSWIGNGFHFCDRQYHYITEAPCPSNLHITADLEEW